MRRPPAQIVAQDAIRRRRRIVRALERGTRFPPHPPPSRGGGGRAVPRRRGGARLLGPRRARFRRARAGNARAQGPPPPLREREALLGEADPVLLGRGGDDAVLRRRREAFRDATSAPLRPRRARLLRRGLRRPARRGKRRAPPRGARPTAA